MEITDDAKVDGGARGPHGSTTLMAASVDAMPHRTRSTLDSDPAFSTALASASEVAKASEPAIASSQMCTPLSAPIWSALRIASNAPAGPMVSTVTSEFIAQLILQPQRVLYGVLVELGQQSVLTVVVGRAVRLEPWCLVQRDLR